MNTPQNPWESGELAGLMAVPKDQGEVIGEYSAGLGFVAGVTPTVLKGKVDSRRFHHTIEELNHILPKENLYNYIFAALLFLFVAAPIAYYYLFAEVIVSPGSKTIVLHDKLLMVICYVILAVDVPILLFVAYTGYKKEANEIHSFFQVLLVIIAFGNTIAYPFALEWMTKEKLSKMFILYPLILPFIGLLSIFINRRLPELLGEANQFVEKENEDYYKGQGMILRLRPERGDRLFLVVNFTDKTYESTAETEVETIGEDAA